MNTRRVAPTGGCWCLHSPPMGRHHASWSPPQLAPPSIGRRSRRAQTVDYLLARRAVLQDLATGRRERHDVCDAHPELLRAGRNIGVTAEDSCPVCGRDRLRLVSYVYGDGLRHANGRCIATDVELERLVATHEEFSRYIVEVCLECRWNHLQRHELHGRRYAS